eukprot:PhM_4_TR6153/c0_g1_i1/m.52325
MGTCGSKKNSERKQREPQPAASTTIANMNNDNKNNKSPTTFPRPNDTDPSSADHAVSSQDIPNNSALVNNGGGGGFRSMENSNGELSTSRTNNTGNTTHRATIIEASEPKQPLTARRHTTSGGGTRAATVIAAASNGTPNGNSSVLETPRQRAASRSGGTIVRPAIPVSPRPANDVAGVEAWKLATYNVWNRGILDSDLKCFHTVAQHLTVREINNRMHHDVFTPDHDSVIDNVCQGLRVLCEVTRCEVGLEIAKAHLDGTAGVEDEDDLNESDLPHVLEDLFHDMFTEPTMKTSESGDMLSVIFRALQLGITAPAVNYVQTRLQQSLPELQYASFTEKEDSTGVVKPPSHILTVHKGTHRLQVEHLVYTRVILPNHVSPQDDLAFNWTITLVMPSYVSGSASTSSSMATLRKYSLIPENVSVQVQDVMIRPDASPRIQSAVLQLMEIFRS